MYYITTLGVSGALRYTTVVCCFLSDILEQEISAIPAIYDPYSNTKGPSKTFSESIGMAPYVSLRRVTIQMHKLASNQHIRPWSEVPGKIVNLQLDKQYFDSP